MGTSDTFFAELKKLNLLFIANNINKSKYDIEIFKSFFKCVDIIEKTEDIEYFDFKKYDLVIIKIKRREETFLHIISDIKKKYPYLYIAVIIDKFKKKDLAHLLEIGIDAFFKENFDLDDFFKEIYKLIYQKIKIAEELNILQQYKDIVDENLIVSKMDTNGYITYVNNAFEKISGFSKEELINKPHYIVNHSDTSRQEVYKQIWDTISSKREWKGLIKNRKKNGESYYVDTVIKPLFDRNGNIREYITLRKDVTHYISAEELINDKLKIIKDALLILVSIDDYKDMKILYYNSILNKLKLKLLTIIKNLLKEKMKLNDDLIEEYIIKEDSFGFLIERYNKNTIQDILNEIINTVINLPINIDEFEFLPFVRISFSFGNKSLYENVLIGMDKIKTKEDRLICANGLCAKKKIKVSQNIQMLKNIEYALKHKKVVSFFQPIVDNKTKQIVKYESLVRIIDKNNEIISPIFFLDIAKKAGLYTNITLHVIENSFKMVKEKNISVSINLSPNDILRDTVKEKIYTLLKEINPPKGMITFELLEDEIVQIPKALKDFIDNVLKLNANIAIDDFGEGYSNFSRIADYKAEIIKIDGSIIKNIDKDITKQSIVQAIVSFAKKENKKTVAEFVENEKIYKILLDLGVDYSQGYYFSKPLIPEDI